MKLGRWSTTAASNNTTPPDGWPEGQAPSTVNDCAREMMASIRAAFSDLQFFDQDFTPTYVSATSFTVPGDQTSAIHAGRRLKIYDATAGVATTIYATVATASFTTVTTVSVSCDAGQLTSSLSSFAIAILSNTNNSLPRSTNTAFDRISASAIETTTLTVSGATTLKSTLSVGGAATFSGGISVSGTVIVNTNVKVIELAGFAAQNLAISLGTATSLVIRIGGVSAWAVDGLTFAWQPLVNNSYDIGSPGAQVRSGYFGTGITDGGTLTVSGATVLKGALSVGGAATFASTLSVSAQAVAGTYVKTGAVTVASLPAAATVGSGGRYMVTDASSLTFGASASGGGANIAPVWSNGTSWLIG